MEPLLFFGHPVAVCGYQPAEHAVDAEQPEEAFRMEANSLRLSSIRLSIILNKPIRAALLTACSILLFSPAIRAGEPPLRARLTQEAIAKSFGAESVRVAANLLETEVFDAAAEVMPDLTERLERPIETATSGADFADMIVRRLGLGDMPGKLDKWHQRPSTVRPATVLKPSDLDRILTGYIKRAGILVAEFPNEPACCDTAAFVEDIRAGGPSGDTLMAVGGAPAGEAARQLAPAFIAEVVSLVDDIAGVLSDEVGEGRSLETPKGRILIGTAGDDRYRIDPDIVLILDPGGNDTYEFPGPVVDGQLTIVDLGGDDHYVGDSLAIHALVALIDLEGDDVYEGTTGAQGATLGGVSLLIDRSGDDRYAAGTFSQAAAAEGVAVLIDGAGNDVYQIEERGQAFGQVGGTALLWDLGGDDRYLAGGPPDTLGREARLSQAQGMGAGLRASHGGGTGVLRDDSGNDSYTVEMFGQGAGYFQAIGVLSDGAGDDRYEGVRYVQGAGVHGAIGLLADGGGNDSYVASHGVGQGMGLDMALGALEDDAGNDSYEAGSLAQGAGTANGMGFLLDGGGTDRFSLNANGWGQDHVARDLPGPSFLIGADWTDRFMRGGEAVAVDIDRVGGPAGGAPYRRDPPGDYACPPTSQSSPAPGSSPTPGAADDLTGVIQRSAPMHGNGVEALAAWRLLGGWLPDHLPALLRAVPDRDFATAFSLLQAVRCHLLAAGPEYRAAIWHGVLDDLAARHPVSQPWLHGRLLTLSRPLDSAPDPGNWDGTLQDGIGRLASHPACSARSAALELARGVIKPGGSLPGWLEQPLRDALADPCLRLPAEAMRLLDRIADPALTSRFAALIARLPAFLSDPAIRADIWLPDP
jgi:hypothetical protein